MKKYMTNLAKALALTIAFTSASMIKSENSGEKLEEKVKTETKVDTLTLKQTMGEKKYLDHLLEERYQLISNKPKYQQAKTQIENKKIPILMFHQVDYTGSRYSNTPEQFEKMLEKLYINGFYAINFKQFAQGNLSEVPIGKKPYLITFDDAHPSQFQYNKITNEINPKSGIGVLEEFFKKNPRSGKGAVFYQSIFGVHKEFIYIFGDRKTAKQKQDYLLENGYWIGEHMLKHENLAKINLKTTIESTTANRAILEKETTKEYEKIAENKKIRTLARPYGAKEKNPEIKQYLKEEYDIIMDATGGKTNLRQSTKFDVYHVPRIEANQWTVRNIIRNQKNQFIQTPQTKKLFEEVYDYNPQIPFQTEEIAQKPIKKIEQTQYKNSLTKINSISDISKTPEYLQQREKALQTTLKNLEK